MAHNYQTKASKLKNHLNMYTAEDIKKAKQYLSEQGYGTGSNITYNDAAYFMVLWAATNNPKQVVEKPICDCPDCI